MGYEYREVICSYCEHRFMARVDQHGLVIGNGFYDRETGNDVRTVLCPMCNKFSYAVGGILESVPEDDERIALKSDN